MRRFDDPASAVTLGGMLLIAGYVFALSQSMRFSTYDMWGAYLIGPLLIAVTIPIVRRVARRTGEDRTIVLIMLAALALKLVAALVRYAVAFEVYGGVSDAAGYAGIGMEFARSFRAGDFAVEPTLGVPGTGFLQIVAGVVFTVIGPTTLGGFLVFAWLSYWGTFMCYRAIRTGLPDADPKRYAMLVFLLPSLLFWPSSLGKDSWMLLTLGLAALGVGKLVVGNRTGIIALGIGVTGMGFVRPHVAAMVLLAALVALIPRRVGRSSARLGARLVVIAAVILGGSLLLQEVESFLGLHGGLSEARDVLEQTEVRTTQGGSRFSAEPVNSVTDLPSAIVTVIFRPFPHEAHNIQTLIASGEGVLLLLLFVAAASRLARAPRTAWREPYLLFAITYSLLFVVAFSGFGNFGILARQRIQLFPLLFVVLALPSHVKDPRSQDGPGAATGSAQVKVAHRTVEIGPSAARAPT